MLSTLVTSAMMLLMVEVSCGMNLQHASASLQNEALRPEADEKVIDERATWLDTRDLEDSFVDLVELSLHQLAAEGRISSDVISNSREDVQPVASAPEKRGGRFQGFCFRKTNTGRFLPYVCWKNEKRRR